MVDEMGETYSTYGRDVTFIRNINQKTYRKRLFENGINLTDIKAVPLYAM